MIQSLDWLILNKGEKRKHICLLWILEKIKETFSIKKQKLSECSCELKYCHHSGVASLIVSGSYHLGPNPAAFLASSLKGGFNGPLKYVLTIEWNFWITSFSTFIVSFSTTPPFDSKLSWSWTGLLALRQRYLNHLTPAAQWVISSG